MNSVDYSEDHDIFDGLQVIGYAGVREGHIAGDLVAGWQPVNIANHQAWLEIKKQAALSREQVCSGRYSPLHYYMTINLMDPGLLAAYTGLFRCRVRLHLRPFFFQRLSPRLLQQYGELFHVPVQDLKNGVLHPFIYDINGPEAVDGD